MALADTSPSASTLTVSPVALRLGYAGLLPFVLGALLTWLVRPDAHPHVVDALAKYGALIVSFLGGIHWGVGMKQSAQSAESHSGSAGAFVWGIVPSLLAWVAVVMPPYAGLALLGALIVLCYLVDRRCYPVYGLRAWMTLRFRLTAVASLSCFIAAAGS